MFSEGEDCDELMGEPVYEQRGAGRVGGDTVSGARGGAEVSGIEPWGNTAPYDLMVEKEGAIYRVQVKSTTTE